MSTITVIGSTGYTGGNVIAEAAARGHRVIGWGRSVPAAPVEGVDYRTGTPAEAVGAIAGSDVVVAALTPRAGLGPSLTGLYESYAATAAEAGTRFIVVGGFSSLRPAPDAPRFAEGDIPEEFHAEALIMDGFREWLATAAPEGLDWTFVSPAGGYGSFNPGERTGSYRLGGEVALFDADGESQVSGADFAIAVVDEIEAHAHPREHISVAY